MTATVDRTEPDLVPDLSDPTAGRVAQAREMASAQVQMIADPAPLGLAAFALTTFLLALGYRSFTLIGHDEVQDDLEDRRIARIRHPAASLETDGDDDRDVADGDEGER